MANHFRTYIKPITPSLSSAQPAFRLLHENENRTWLQAWLLPDSIMRVALGETAQQAVTSGAVLWQGFIFDLPDYKGELWGTFVPYTPPASPTPPNPVNTPKSVADIGEIRMYAGGAAGSGTPIILDSGTWLLCDGSVVLISLYQKLFNLIGSTYQQGAVTTGYFWLPDLARRYPVGVASNQALASSEQILDPTQRATIHSHTLSTANGSTGVAVGTGAQNALRFADYDGHNHSGNTGNSLGVNSFPHLTLNFIICADNTTFAVQPTVAQADTPPITEQGGFGTPYDYGPNAPANMLFVTEYFETRQ